MTKQLAVQGFDYSELDKDTADKLKCLAQSGHRAVRQSMIKFIHDFGKELTEARKLLAKHGEGTFCRWATQEFDISRQTVYNYLNGYGRGLSNGLTNCDALTPTALYLATAESTPEDIIPKVKKLAAKQQVVTRSDVQAIIDREYPPDTPDEDIIDETPSTPIRGNSVEPVPDCDPSPLDTPEPPEFQPEDFGKCPNCAGVKWKTDEDGTYCARCNHPHGEATGGPDEQRVATQRSKTIKTVEALMRAFDDLQHLMSSPDYEDAIIDCKRLLKVARGWK